MSKNIGIKAGLDRSIYLKKEGSDFIYLYVEIKGGKVETNEERLPLNLGLVLDKSGSMSGEKIKFAKEAVKFVATNLNANDKFSLVEYSSGVNVLVPSSNLKNKQQILKIVDGIGTSGMTNLSGGMLEGFNQVKSSFEKEGMVNRVFLLSDGLANRGITEHAKLLELARKAQAKEGISLSTFGIGTGFNEKLMMDLAEYGGGNQFFIGLPEDIPGIFAQELQGLLAVLAQNAAFSIEYPYEYLSLERSYGLPLQSRKDRIDGHLGDLFSEDNKAFLLKFKVNKPIDRNLNFKLELAYDDVVEEMGRVNVNQAFHLELSEDPGVVEVSGDKSVMEQVALFEANARHQELLVLLRKREFEKVRQGAKDLISFIEAQLLHFPNSEDLKAQLETTKELFEEIDEFQQQDMMAQEMAMKHYASRNKYVEKKQMKNLASRLDMRMDEKNS